MATVGGKTLAVLMAVILTVSIIGPVAAVGGTASVSQENLSTQQSQTAFEEHDDQFFEVDDEVRMWERSAAFPFRVSDGSQPETEVRHPNLRLFHSNPGEVPIQRDSIGVFGETQSVELVFSTETGAPAKNFEDARVDLLAVETDIRQDEAGPQADDLQALLNGSSNARYEIADTTTLDDSNGNLAEFSYDFGADHRGSDDYVFFLVNNGSYTVDDGNVSSVSDARVLGMDFAFVQSAESDVAFSKSEYRIGETLEVDVDSNLQSGDTTHSVILFNQTDLIEQTGDSSQEWIEIEYTGEMDSIRNASAEDFNFTSSLGAADGELSIGEGVSLFGNELDAQEREGHFPFQAIVDTLVTQFSIGDAETTPGDNVLNMSMTAVSGADASTTLEVGTTRNFTAGEYDVLHVAEHEESGDLSTNRTTVTLDGPPVSGAKFDIGIDDVQPEGEILAGIDTIEVNATVTNGDSLEDTQSVDLLFDRTVVDTEEVTLGPHESTGVDFTYATSSQDVGSSELSVASADDTASRSVNVSEPDDANFAVDLELDDSSDLTAGDTITGNLTVENVGDYAGTQNVTATFADRTVDEAELTLEPGETQTLEEISIDTREDEAGDQLVVAESDNDRVVRSVRLLRPPTFEVDVVESESRLDPVAGQDAILVVEVENVGEVDGEKTETITVTDSSDGSTFDASDVTLAPGENDDVELRVPTSSEGTFDVNVNSSDDEETVEIEVSESNAIVDVEIIGLPTDVDEPASGAVDVPVDVNVSNPGDVPTTQDLKFLVNGESQAVETDVTVDGGEEQTITVDVPIRTGDGPTADIEVRSENESDSDELPIDTLDEFEVTIVEASDADEPIPENTTFNSTITLTNVGDQTGAAEVTIRFNDTIVKTFDSLGSVSGGETITITQPGDGVDINASDPGTKLLEAEVNNTRTADAIEDRSTRSLTIGSAPNFEVREFQAPPEIVEGEEIIVNATIHNTGDVEGNQTVLFTVEGDQRASRELTELGPDDEREIEFSYETRSNDIGEVSVEIISDDDSATADVPVLQDATFEVADVLVDEEVIVDEPFDVDVVVRNVGDVKGTDDIRLYVGSDEVDSKSETIENDSATVVTFENVTHDKVGGTDVAGVTSDDYERRSVDVGSPGQLELDIRSVTDPVTTNDTFETALRARNVGDGDVTNEDVVLLVEDADGNLVQTDVRSIDVAGGESRRLTLQDRDVIDRTIDEATSVDFEVRSADDTDAGTFTLTPPPEDPFFRISNIDAPDQVLNASGETVTVNATVSNVGDQNDTQEVRLTVGGETLETKTNELEGGENTTVEFEFDATEVGAGDVIPVEVASEDHSAATSIRITEPVPGTPRIVDVEYDERATQDEPVDVNVTVANVGDLPLDGTAELEYFGADTVVVEDTVDLASGETTTKTLTVTPPAEPRAGEFERAFMVNVTSNADDVPPAVTGESLVVDFEGIQSGEEAATEGETVLIAPGTYSARNRITVTTSNVTLQAASPIDPPVVEMPRRDETALKIAADGVTVNRIHFLDDDPSTGTAVEIDAKETRISSARIRGWERGVHEASGANNNIDATRIVDSGTGITLAGDGNGGITFASIARVDSGILLESDNNSVMFSHIVNAETGIEIRDEDNLVFATTVRDNRFGILPIGPGDPSKSRNFIHQSNIVGNDIGVFVDGDNVDATGNWWGGPPARGEDYIARSSIDTANHQDEPLDPANFMVETVETPDEVDRDARFTVNATIENTGEQSDSQDVELVDGSTTVDTRTLQLGEEESREITLAYTPDLTTGDELDLRVRTDDGSSGTQTVTVVDPELNVTIDANASSDKVQKDETVEIVAEVENLATSTDLEQPIELRVGGSTVESSLVAVEAGSTVTRTFEYETGSADVGELGFTVASPDAESDEHTVTVAELPDFQVDIDEASTETELEAGDTLSVTVDLTNDGGPGEQDVELLFDGSVVDSVSKNLGDSATDSVTLTYETKSGDVGEAIPVNVSAVGTDEEQILVNVSAADRPGSPGRGPGGSPPATPGPDPKPDPVPGKTVDARPNSNAADVAFENVRANNPTEVELPDVVGTDETTISSIGFTTTDDVPRLNMSVCACESVPDGEAPALDAGDAISYIEVTVDSETTFEYEDATFTFSVAEEALEERDVEPEQVSLYRFNETADEWRQLPTEHVEGDTYTATSPGFSVFAIGTTQQDDVEVSDATVDQEETDPGEPVVVTATVENTGDEADTFTTDLTVDGEVVDSREVTLDPGESVEVRFEQTFEEAGSYDLAVSGAVAGSVTVESDDDAPAGPVEEGLISPSVVLVVVLVLILMATGVAYYARESEEFDFGR